MQDGAPVRQSRSGHHVHELRVRHGTLVRPSCAQAESAGWDANQARPIRPSCVLLSGHPAEMGTGQASAKMLVPTRQ